MGILDNPNKPVTEDCRTAYAPLASHPTTDNPSLDDRLGIPKSEFASVSSADVKNAEGLDLDGTKKIALNKKKS